MAVEPAIAFLRSLEHPRPLAPVILINGPHAFLREYTFDVLSRTLRHQGFKYRAFQVGGAGFGAVLEELFETDLFAPKRILACRVLKTHREAGEDERKGPGSRLNAGGDESALAEAIAGFNTPNHLVMLYERDNAPAKIRRAVEKSGLVVTCMRPFNNQLGQYAGLFARLAGYRLAPEAQEMLVVSFAGDLGAICNAVQKAGLGHQAGQLLQVEDFSERHQGRAPELFDIAESLARGDLGGTLTRLERATAVGRDELEILGVEVVPVIRRMMVAAAILANGQGTQAVAAALGMAPGSHLAAQAIDGARRFGSASLARAHRAVCELDASIKAGLVKEAREALAELIIELLGDERKSAT